MVAPADGLDRRVPLGPAGALVDAWLARDVQAPGGPLRQAYPGVEIPPDAGLAPLGAAVVTALETGALDDARSWLGGDRMTGFPDVLLVHALQLLVARARITAAEADPGDAELVAHRGDRLLRELLGHRLTRVRDALPRDGAPFLELASVLTDTLYSTLASGMVRYVSPGIEELTGHPADRFLDDQHLWSRLVVAEDRPKMASQFREVIELAEPREVSYRVQHEPSGRVREVLDRAIPVVVDGKVVRVDGLVVDITERVELEQRLERSGQLKSLGQLARDVAHDFNNLLVSIIGHADLLLARMPPESRDAHALRLIAAAADKGSKLTERLLAFARGAATSGAKEVVQLERVAHDAMELARPSVPAHMRLEMSVSAGVPAVRADGARIGEAVLNLVLNAIQACTAAEMGERVDVAARPATDAEAGRIGRAPAVVLEVRDDGPGMTEAVKARVFEPMFTTRGRDGGTGLGCAMAYGVAVDHGGVLEVESERGAGALFRMILPAASPGEAVAASPELALPPRRSSEPTARSTAQAGAARGPRILVVDDEPSVRQLLKDLLEGAGYQVETVGGGHEAVRRVAGDGAAIDLVILDVMMHPMDGTAAFAELRGLRPELPIIFCTGHSDATVIAVPSAMDQAPVIQKPFRVAQLIRAVRQALT